ncbi:MAG: molybdenum cofactor biosynthesis protein MoaE [Gammaproteobacteria bacterium]|nr:molybdenum cofactor biosynthesis protein MoaE [Gammaproteobacteria bacterium]
MHVAVIDTALDPLAEVQRYQGAQPHLQGQVGATAIFIGSMRDFNQDQTVVRMELEHYPGMTEHYLQKIAQQALQQWPIADLLILHRVGIIIPNDPIVVVAVWSAHRAAAYAANRFLMEDLKSHAPFWKKETLDNHHSRWVEKNTPA